MEHLDIDLRHISEEEVVLGFHSIEPSSFYEQNSFQEYPLFPVKIDIG